MLSVNNYKFTLFCFFSFLHFEHLFYFIRFHTMLVCICNKANNLNQVSLLRLILACFYSRVNRLPAKSLLEARI